MFTIFKKNCINPKQHFICTSTQVVDNFTRDVQLSSTNIKTGVVRNSYQMH